MARTLSALARLARSMRPRVVIKRRLRRALPDGLREALRTARLDAGWTQRQLAMAARLSQSMVARLEDGERSPSRNTIDRLAIALNLDPEIHDALLEHARPPRGLRGTAGLVGKAVATPFRIQELAELKRQAASDRATGRRQQKGGRPVRRIGRGGFGRRTRRSAR